MLVFAQDPTCTHIHRCLEDRLKPAAIDSMQRIREKIEYEMDVEMRASHVIMSCSVILA